MAWVLPVSIFAALTMYAVGRVGNEFTLQMNMTYEDAKRYCWSLPTGHLPDDRVDTTALTELMLHKQVTSVWMGIRAVKHDNWKWTDGDQDTPLGPEQGTGGRVCGGVSTVSQNIQPKSCNYGSNLEGVVCQHGVNLDYCRKTFTQWHCFSGDSVVFSFKCGVDNWYDARFKCQMLNASIAKLNSTDKIEEFVTNKNKIPSLSLCNFFWVGLRKEEWMIEHSGEESEELTKALWLPQEPLYGPQCVTFEIRSASRGWKSNQCSNKHAMVCETHKQVHTATTENISLSEEDTRPTVSSPGRFGLYTGIGLVTGILIVSVCIICLVRRRRQQKQRRHISQEEETLNLLKAPGTAIVHPDNEPVCRDILEKPGSDHQKEENVEHQEKNPIGENGIAKTDPQDKNQEKCENGIAETDFQDKNQEKCENGIAETDPQDKNQEKCENGIAETDPQDKNQEKCANDIAETDPQGKNQEKDGSEAKVQESQMKIREKPYKQRDHSDDWNKMLTLLGQLKEYPVSVAVLSRPYYSTRMKAYQKEQHSPTIFELLLQVKEADRLHEYFKLFSMQHVTIEKDKTITPDVITKGHKVIIVTSAAVPQRYLFNLSELKEATPHTEVSGDVPKDAELGFLSVLRELQQNHVLVAGEELPQLNEELCIIRPVPVNYPRGYTGADFLVSVPTNPDLTVMYQSAALYTTLVISMVLRLAERNLTERMLHKELRNTRRMKEVLLRMCEPSSGPDQPGLLDPWSHLTSWEGFKKVTLTGSREQSNQNASAPEKESEGTADD